MSTYVYSGSTATIAANAYTEIDFNTQGISFSSLAFAKDGTKLVITIGGETLTLTGYFTSADGVNPVAVDFLSYQSPPTFLVRDGQNGDTLRSLTTIVNNNFTSAFISHNLYISTIYN